MMEAITQTRSFGLVLTLVIYALSKKLEEKVKSPITSALVTAPVAIIAILLLTGTSYENYMYGASFLSYFIAPATVCLAVYIYQNREVLKKNVIPLVVGLAVGIALHALLIGFLCRLVGLDSVLSNAMYSKSVTSAISMEIATILGTDPSLAIAFTMLTGMVGGVIGLQVLKLFRITNPLAQGAALGSSIHAMGVAKGLELGKTQGAVAGLSMGLAGMISVVVIPLVAQLFAG